MRQAGDLGGKIVFDCTNPLAPQLSGLTHGHDTSGGEQVAAWAPGARVVKVFNIIGAAGAAVDPAGVRPEDGAGHRVQADAPLRRAGRRLSSVGRTKNHMGRRSSPYERTARPNGERARASG